MGHIPTMFQILYGSTAAGLYDQAAALSILEKLYGRLARHLLTDSLLSPLLHDQPLSLTTGSSLQGRETVTTVIQLPFSATFLELVLCTDQVEGKEEESKRAVYLHYLAFIILYF